MAVDFLPNGDDELVAWMTQFLAYATANLGALGLVAGDLTGLTAAKVAFVAQLAAQRAAIAAAKVATEAKQSGRDDCEEGFRSLARVLQATAGITPAQLGGLGLTIADTTRSKAPAPTTRPVVTVDTRERLQHLLRWFDEMTPGSRARPDGYEGVQIYRAITAQGAPAPTSVSQLAMIAIDSATPYLVEYDGADAGKVAWYWLRWENKQGNGPWSEPVSATIGG